MSRPARGFAAVALVAMFALMLRGIAPAAEGARNSTPTPTPTPTTQPSPSPTVCPIGLPTLPSVGAPCTSGYVCWSDSSNNEDGFHIDVIRCGVSYHFEVPANTTRFALPAEASDPCCGDWDKITAFNACGLSTLTTEFGALCLPPATATAAALPQPTWSPDLPLAPGGVRVDCRATYWNDTSDNEDGFFIDVTVCGGTVLEQHFHYEVPANSAEFVFPEEYHEAEALCPNSFTERWAVGAFNSHGRSQGGGGQGPIVHCATPTPLPGISLPSDGDRGGSASASWAMGLLVGGVASLAGGVALFARSRTQSKPVQ